MNAQIVPNFLANRGRDAAEFFEINETRNRNQAFFGYEIVSGLKSARRFGIGNDEIVTQPMKLKMAGMSGRHARDSSDPAEQDTEEMRPAHVGMDHIEFFLTDPLGDPPKLRGWQPIHFGFPSLDPGPTESAPNPGPWAAEQLHLVTATAQLAGQQIDVHHRSVNKLARDDLQNFHDKGNRECQNRPVGMVIAPKPHRPSQRQFIDPVDPPAERLTQLIW